jgi:lipopolysaccharide export system protein LptA
MMPLLAVLVALAISCAPPAFAQQRAPQSLQGPQTTQAVQTPPAASPGPARPSALGNLGASNKEPIKIDADRLDVFDKEQRAVFSGSVVAVQGESTIRCTELTVLYEQQRGQGRASPVPPGGQNDSAIRRIDCKGPVTIVSRTQTATGDHAVFDRTANRILMTGNVALSDGQNVTTGERIVYDLNAGIANIETKPGGRVRAMFVPGSNPEGGPTAQSAANPPAPDRSPNRRSSSAN